MWIFINFDTHNHGQGHAHVNKHGLITGQEHLIVGGQGHEYVDRQWNELNDGQEH